MDITERKRAETALIRLAAIVESSDDAIIGTDQNSIITNWNKGAEKIFGYTAREMVGTSILRLIPDDRQDEEGQIMEKIKRGESMNHFETLRQTKDRRLIDVSLTASPIKDATGRIIGVSKVARDITERRKLESQFRQAQKMEAVGQLAGGVAHDFNNILAVIQMQSGLLKARGNLSPEHMESAEEIGAASQRAAVLTRQLLLFSRKEILQLRDLDLNQSIKDMVKMLQRTLGEDIQLQFKFAMQSLFIHADAGMIDQVLMNLAVNARDAMPKGGQFVIETSAVDFDESVRAQSARAGSGSLVCLSVSDTGCGIPPEILPRIFEPFFTTKDVGKGTGLGLATVFGIVGQHQGWINVHSEVGHGTTFHIYLPQLTKISRQKPERPALTFMRGGNETILLVEDDAFLRASVRKTLSQLGYRVLEAINGNEALEVWKQNRDRIHLLLTDLVMPGGMTGKDLGKRLLKENPRLKVIYTSGYSAKVADGNFPWEDGVNFLTKPFNAQKLAQTVRQNLDANIQLA
jgi:PAS domain S-box-containing protein